MKSFKFLMLLAVLILAGTACFSQNAPDTTRITRIETRDGNTYTGYVASQDTVALILRTDNLGDIRIPRSEIISIREFRNMAKVKGRYWLPNPQSTSYFWAPNGYGLNKGEGYYQNIWILYNQFTGGLANNFSLGGGLIPLFFFGGTATPLWIMPKISIPVVRDKLNIGTGALLGTIAGSENPGFFGLLFGIATFGTRDKNMSFGLAYGFAEGGMTRLPVFNVSGLLRVGPKGYLITENYIVPSENSTLVILSGGGRTLVKNISIDYGLWLPVTRDMDPFVIIPSLGINVQLGKNR